MKLFLINLLAVIMLTGFAQQKFPAGGRGKLPPKHPLIAALESDSFSPEERARLKALSEKDMKAFFKEMQKHFMLKKKAESIKILELRKKVLDAKTADEKKKAEEALRAELKKKEEERLAFHKKILDKTEQHLKAMQERYDKLRKVYELRKQNREQIVEKKVKDILAAAPPEFLQECADWEPGKPYPKFPIPKR